VVVLIVSGRPTISAVDRDQPRVLVQLDAEQGNDARQGGEVRQRDHGSVMVRLACQGASLTTSF